MGLLVKTLELQDFRSFGEKVVGLAPATTILCGPNAAGKTNTVEALQLLTAGYSFRHPTPAQLVREGAQAARASARLEGDGRVVDLRCDVVSGRRQFFRNGKRIQASEVSGTLMSVLFTPDDLQLVKRSASFRRDELDDFGRQANRGFASMTAFGLVKRSQTLDVRKYSLPRGSTVGTSEDGSSARRLSGERVTLGSVNVYPLLHAPWYLPVFSLNVNVPKTQSVQ